MNEAIRVTTARALRLLGTAMVGVALLLVFAALFFWWGWLRVPSPETVCDHALAIAAEDPGVPLDGLRMECIRNAQPPEYGRLAYTRAIKCVMAARSSAQLRACKSGL